jgi:sulfide:quinone oxidoreductase
MSTICERELSSLRCLLVEELEFVHPTMMNRIRRLPVPATLCSTRIYHPTQVLYTNTRAYAVASNVLPAGSASRHHRVVVVGGGAAGLSISHQLLRSGNFRQNDIALVDPAAWHDYQPGWTLVGGGLRTKQSLRRPMESLIDPKIRHYHDKVDSFNPDQNSILLSGIRQLHYDHLVVAPGITLNIDAIKGLREALASQDSPVSTIYSYDYCDKVSRNIKAFSRGKAIFTQPAGTVKCAGGPQKIMWLALDHWKQNGSYNIKQPLDSPIQITFATGIAAMFGVPKYSKRLDELRQARGVEGLFQHDLTAVDGNKATFALPDGKGQLSRHFDFL